MDEIIIREYFEQNGFLTRRLKRKPRVGRAVSGDGEVVLTIVADRPALPATQQSFYLFSSGLPQINQAVVVWKGWNEPRLLSGSQRSSGELVRFVAKEAPRQLLQTFELDELPGEKNGAHILILPAFPVQEPHRSQLEETLRRYDVDYVLSFRAILQYLIEHADAAAAVPNAGLFSLFQLLKTYDLLKSPQLELFQEKREK